MIFDLHNIGIYEIGHLDDDGGARGGGMEPTITSGGSDTIILTTTDGGANWRGYVAGQAFV